MIELRQARIRRVVGTSAGRVDLELEERPGGPAVAAVALPALGSFRWRPGLRVWVNTTARCLRLGSGGFDVAVAPCQRSAAPTSAAGWLDRRHGHIMKLRYTPLQLAVLACEEPRGPYHRCLRRFVPLNGLPVGVLSLHSMLGPVACAFYASWGCRRKPRLAFVMTDSAALPAAVSGLLERLVARRLLQLVVTCGQAFGGHLEAVHPASALAACARSGADAVLVGPGPGVVGTGTAVGTSCLEVAGLADLTAAMGGQAVVVARLSFGDRRARHRGVSHHLLTALGKLSGGPHHVVLPGELLRRQRAEVLGQLASAGVLRRHRVVAVRPPRRQALRDLLGEGWATMGRTADDDPIFWDACAAAGRYLAELAARRV
ncbi:MAG TPA: DUF3866 family protein [Limnochordales bacterium]